MGVDLEGAKVALHMRKQMIAMQRQFNELLRLLGQELNRQGPRSVTMRSPSFLRTARAKAAQRLRLWP